LSRQKITKVIIVATRVTRKHSLRKTASAEAGTERQNCAGSNG
jgi:hypothetical protein